jgi:hypothetical protein
MASFAVPYGVSEEEMAKAMGDAVAEPQPEPAQDAVVVRRAKDSKGRFKADDLRTPEDEAWEELS